MVCSLAILSGPQFKKFAESIERQLQFYLAEVILAISLRLNATISRRNFFRRGSIFLSQ